MTLNSSPMLLTTDQLTKDYGARVEELKEKRNELRRKLGIAGEERP